jgi:dipeptidase
MKIIRFLIVFVVLGSLFSGIPQSGYCCTTILIGSKATADGAVIHAHNEDMGFSAVGRLWHVPAATHDTKSILDVPYVTLPQKAATYRYWASGNAFAAKGLGISEAQQAYDAVLVGLNEWGVSLSCNWMWSREANMPQKGIRRYAIRQLVLERAKTAREAVRMIGDFIDTYGQADWGGLGYCLADPREAWIVETTTNHWVARKVADDEILVVANRFTIGSEYDMASKELLHFAQQKEWHNTPTEPFSFRKAYGRPDRMEQAYDIDREKRAVFLLKDKQGSIRPIDLFSVLRDRFEGTDKYTKPIDEENWREHSEKNRIPRTISTNLCQSSSVAHLRPGLPVSMGAMMWYATGAPQYTGYFPIYAGATKIPEAYRKEDSAYSLDSAWWISKMLQREVEKNYEAAYAALKGFWSKNHDQMAQKMETLEKKALAMMKLLVRKVVNQLLS